MSIYRFNHCGPGLIAALHSAVFRVPSTAAGAQNLQVPQRSVSKKIKESV